METFFANLEIVTRYLRGDRAGISFTQFMAAVFGTAKTIFENLGGSGQLEALPLTASLEAIDDAELASLIEREIPESLREGSGRPEVLGALDPAILTTLLPLIMEVLRRFLSR